MSSKPVLIAQISDLHIKPPGALAYGRVDTATALERCVAALNAFEPAPDFVVISGDLADTPTVEEYDYLKRLLAPLRLPFAGIPGNHDLVSWCGPHSRLHRTFMQPARSTKRSTQTASISCCLIQACPGSRTARSRRPHCNGSTRRWRRRLIDRR